MSSRLTILFVLLAPLSAAADTLTLKNGQKLHGSVDSQNSTAVVISVGKTSKTIPRDQIDSISYDIHPKSGGRPQRAGRSGGSNAKTVDMGRGNAAVVYFRRSVCPVCDGVETVMTRKLKLKYAVINTDRSPDDSIWLARQCHEQKLECGMPCALIRGKVYTYAVSAEENARMMSALEKESKRHR